MNQEICMPESKIQRLNRLDLDEVCEMIADGASLAQIGTRFDRSLNVIGNAGLVEVKPMPTIKID